MRQLLLLVVCSTLSWTAKAIIRTVSNTPSTIAQFNTIQAAVDASNNDDTVYVHGSPNAYAAFTINNKRIVVIGPGWSPNKNLPLTAVVPGITITGASASGTEIQGLVITSTLNMNSSKPDNLRFIRNYFSFISIAVQQGSVTYSGYLFEGNVFDNAGVDGTSGSTYQNFLFQNNYFYDNGCCRAYALNSFTNSINVLLDHNLWFGPSTGVTNCFVNNCRFLLLTNNIFVRRNAGVQNSNSTFNNNLTFFPAGSTPPADPWSVNGNVNSGGNVSNQDPQMVAQASVNAGTNNALADYTIAAGPANNSGSDGKDMGLLYDAVGSLNWTFSRSSRLPFIFSMNITNPTIASGGTLNVQVEARKNN